MDQEHHYSASPGQSPSQEGYGDVPFAPHRHHPSLSPQRESLTTARRI